tara:strand:+ start:3646 stop:5076 length:1431 start_codon:yes stop_codon:yes gene_type:complete
VSESILEKALLEAEQLEETMKSNAKEILSSTMKKEIHELVKESLNEDDYLPEQEEEEEVDVLDIEDDMDGVEPEMELELPDDIELDIEDETEDEPELPELPPLDLTLASDEEVLKVFKAMGDEDGIIIQQDDDKIELTDTNTETEYIIKLEESKKAKTMKKAVNENKTEVSETEDMDNMYETEDEDDVVYEIELSEDDDIGADDEGEGEVTEDADWGENKHEFKRRSSGGVKHRTGDVGGGNYGKGGHYKDYELDEDSEWGGNKDDYHREMDSAGHKTKTGDVGGGKYGRGGHYKDYEMEGEMDEASRTLGFGRKSNGKHKPSGIRKAISNNRNLGESRLRKSYNLLKEEVDTLKVKNTDYKKALTTFRDKLNEVGVFNSNLAYVTRLFTEHSTTKQEKINVLKRFDNIDSLKSSKKLYKVIKEELSQNVAKPTKTIAESVENKITKSPTSGGKLLESKVYENPQFSRMKDLMSKM